MPILNPALVCYPWATKHRPAKADPRGADQREAGRSIYLTPTRNRAC